MIRIALFYGPIILGFSDLVAGMSLSFSYSAILTWIANLLQMFWLLVPKTMTLHFD